MIDERGDEVSFLVSFSEISRVLVHLGQSSQFQVFSEPEKFEEESTVSIFIYSDIYS